MAKAKAKSQMEQSKPRQAISNGHRQAVSNGHSNGSNSGDSISVVQAVARLGVSVSTIKRMCHDGELEWFRTRGPNGHIRILAESVEKVRQGGKLDQNQNSSGVSGLADVKRDTVATLRAELDERKLKRELGKLDEEDANAQRERDALSRAQRREVRARLEEARLQRDRIKQEQEHDRAEQARRDWERAWLSGAAKQFPEWLSPEQEQIVITALRSTLAGFDVSDSDDGIGKALERVIERVIAPWRAEREFRLKVGNIFEVCSWPRWFPYGTTENERLVAVAAGRQSLGLIPRTSTEAEIRAFINDAFAPHKERIQERLNREAADVEAVRARESAKWSGIIQKAMDDTERRKRESEINDLAQHAEGCVAAYLSDLYGNGEIDRDALQDSAWQDDLRAQVHETIEAEFSGTESNVDAERAAYKIVDAALRHEE